MCLCNDRFSEHTVCCALTCCSVTLDAFSMTPSELLIRVEHKLLLENKCVKVSTFLPVALTVGGEVVNRRGSEFFGSVLSIHLDRELLVCFHSLNKFSRSEFCF